MLIAPAPTHKCLKVSETGSVGVFKEVEPRPVNVIMTALPIPPRKVTEFVPLPAQPTHVNVPDVEKVTGSAFASDAPSASIDTSKALIKPALKNVAMFAPYKRPLIVRPHLAPHGGNAISWLA